MVSARSARAATARARTGWSALTGLLTLACWRTWSAGLYGVPPLDSVLIRPVVVLETEHGRAELFNGVRSGVRTFVYFQDKLGGEIGLSKTTASPELSFDITVVELLPSPASSRGDRPAGRHREVRRDRAPDDRHAWQLQPRRQGAHQRARSARGALLRATGGKPRVGGAEDRGAEHLQRLQAHLLPDRVQVPGDQARARQSAAPSRCRGPCGIPGSPSSAHPNSTSSPTAPGG